MSLGHPPMTDRSINTSYLLAASYRTRGAQRKRGYLFATLGSYNTISACARVYRLIMEQAVVALVREATEEVVEEFVKKGAKEFAKQGAKHISGKVVKDAFKGAAAGALETTLTTTAKQELAQEIIEQLTATGTRELWEQGVIVTTKTATGQIRKRVIIQAVGSGGEAVGKGASKVFKVSGVGLAVDVVFLVVFLTNDAFRYHNGGISGTELVVNTASNALGIPVGLVGAAIGQDLIPIPVVGGLVGGVIGAVAGNLLVHTLKTVLT